MFNIFHFSEYLAAEINEKFWKFVDLSQTVSFSQDSGIYAKLDYDLKLWLLKDASTLLCLGVSNTFWVSVSNFETGVSQ